MANTLSSTCRYITIFPCASEKHLRTPCALPGNPQATFLHNPFIFNTRAITQTISAQQPSLQVNRKTQKHGSKQKTGLSNQSVNLFQDGTTSTPAKPLRSFCAVSVAHYPHKPLRINTTTSHLRKQKNLAHITQTNPYLYASAPKPPQTKNASISPAFKSLSTKKRRTRSSHCFSALTFVGSTGEMSNQIWDDLIEIYKVAKKLNL
jgi:hypothetical protein